MNLHLTSKTQLNFEKVLQIKSQNQRNLVGPHCCKMQVMLKYHKEKCDIKCLCQTKKSSKTGMSKQKSQKCNSAKIEGVMGEKYGIMQYAMVSTVMTVTMPMKIGCHGLFVIGSSMGTNTLQMFTSGQWPTAYVKLTLP
jgi:S-adenosylmethionine synthetase